MADLQTPLDYALLAYDNGLCVVPPREDGSKRPESLWKQYQQERPPRELVKAWYRDGHRTGIGIVCGHVSGYLEMLEFEGRARDLWKPFVAACEAAGLKELIDKIVAGYAEFTPTGGIHLLYRCTAVEGNLKIARRPATAAELVDNPDERIKVLIETRGEGGYVIVAPSQGNVHPSGQAWELRSGGFDHIEAITADERAALLDIARSFNQIGADLPPEPRPLPTADSSDEDRPGDIYNRQPGIAATTLGLLLRHGWTEDHQAAHDGHTDIHLRRPGKTDGSSAVLHMDAGTLYVFTTSSADFNSEDHYSPFAVYAVLEHGSDYKAAARSLAPPAERQTFDEFIIAPADDPAPELDDAPPTGPQPIHWPSFWQREHIGEDWIVEPVVPRGRQVALWAKHKTGKSLLSLEIAAAVATGQPCLAQGPSEPLNVMYVDLEMTEDDLHDRLDEMGYGPDIDLTNLHYYLLPSLPPLDSPEGGVAVVNLAIRHQAQLVVIDTMARAVAGDENDADTYRDFYRYTGLHLKARGISMMRLDHGGKDATKGQRGSSGKGDDVDVVWQLRLEQDGLTLRRDAARMSWVPERVALRRQDNPLRHVLTEGLWPAGTVAVASEMDAIGIPLTASQTAAAKAFRAGGGAAKTDVIRAAWKYRRQQDTSWIGSAE